MAVRVPVGTRTQSKGDAGRKGIRHRSAPQTCPEQSASGAMNFGHISVKSA